MLTREIGHEITEPDIFSYALTHKLTLSVNFAGAVGGIFGSYDTKWNGNVGVTRFMPSEDKFHGALNSEALELELTNCHVGRGIVDHIYKKLLGLPALPLPNEGDLAVHADQPKYSESADEIYYCYDTVFMVRNVSYNDVTGMLQSRVTEDRTIEGGFVVGAAAIQEFIRHAKEPDNINAMPCSQTPEQGVDEQALPDLQTLANAEAVRMHNGGKGHKVTRKAVARAVKASLSKDDPRRILDDGTFERRINASIYKKKLLTQG